MTVGQFDLTLGPYSVGTNLNFFLFGLVAYQYAHYWDSNYRDSFLIRGLVSWLLFVDILHTVLEGYMLWLYTITHFAEPEYLGVVNWVFCVTPMLVAFSSIPVQLFLSYRVFLLSKSKALFAFTATCAITQGLAAIGTSIGCYILSDITKLQNLTPIVCLWFPVQIICDLTLTSSLIWTLKRSKTGYSSTDSVVKRLIRASVETAFFALLFVILDMSLFFGFPTTNLHIIFAFTTGRIYSNALLGTLNARTAHREALHGGARSQPNIYHMSPPTTTLGNGDIKSHAQSHPIAISVSHVIENANEDDGSMNGRQYSVDRKV